MISPYNVIVWWDEHQEVYPKACERKVGLLDGKIGTWMLSCTHQGSFPLSNLRRHLPWSR